MKKEKNTICFSWLIYPIFAFILGTAFSCAGMIPDSAFKGAEFVPPEQDVSEMEADVTQEAYKDFTMASINITHGRYDEARDYLLEALRNDPDSVYLNQKMAVLLKEMKDYKAALQYAKKSLELDPTNIGNRILLAEIYAASGVLP